MIGLQQSKAYLHETVPGSPIPKRLIERITSFAGHPKWEVRKACAEALGIVAMSKATIQLQQLSNDPVSYVRQAAEKSLREAKRVTTKIYEKRDPTGEHLFALIKRLNPHNIREAYAAALQVGQIYYRELAGITTHELNTSLFVLKGRIDDLIEVAEGKSSDSLDAHRALIQSATEDLLRLLTGLAELTVEPQKQESFALVPVIQQAIDEARTASLQTHWNEVEIIPIGLWGETKLTGDPTFLCVALRNLIRNAIEASSTGDKIIVTLDIEDSKTVISIQDSGSGMSEQQIEDAFKPFSSSKKGQGGMGLGIPVARKVVYFDFEGELRYESELGNGTRVFIELPISRPSDA